MKTITIQFTRQSTYTKTIKASDKLADRLLKLDGESDLIQKNGIWDGGEEDDEDVEKDVYKLGDVSSDDFTMLAEDLTDMHDIFDSLNEIDDINITQEN